MRRSGDDDVLGPRGAVEEVPLVQLPFLAFHDQRALASQDEKRLLRVFPVVHPDSLAGRAETLTFDPPEVRESLLALERAVGAERTFAAPA